MGAICVKCHTDVGCGCNLDDDYRSPTAGMCWGCRNTYNSSTTTTNTTVNNNPPNPNLVKAIPQRP